MNLQFVHPEYLWFLLIILPCVAWYIYSSRTRYASMAVSTIEPFHRCRTSKLYILHALFAVRMLAIAALIVVIARPRSSSRWENTTTEGTDIILALDVSSSMLATDLKPNRLEAAKQVSKRFVSGRESDNVGLVVFAGECFTAVPMTTDHTQLINYIDDVTVGWLDDGTAIGDGIATAINRLEESKAKSKSIILLTDGSYNAGLLSPLDAAEIAAKKGIKVYTIGAGKNGNALYPQRDNFGNTYMISIPVVIDENTLTQIATKTGGKFFRAENEDVLTDIFDEIDRLEKSETSVMRSVSYEERYLPWAILAGCLLLFELLMRTIVLKHLP